MILNQLFIFQLEKNTRLDKIDEDEIEVEAEPELWETPSSAKNAYIDYNFRER